MLRQRSALKPVDWAVVLALWGLAGVCAGLSGRPGGMERAGYAPVPRAGGGLRVLTWNIGGTDGQPASDDHVSHVAAVLQELDPDIAVIQELSGRRQFQHLVSMLGHAWSGRSVDQGDRRLAIMAQRGNLGARSIARDSGRPAAIGRYKPHDAAEILLAGLHADAYSADGRNAVIGAAVDRLQRSPAGTPRILAGDLNIDLDLDKRHDLFSENTHLDVESYNYITRHFFDIGVDQGSTAKPDRRLDYIFISPELGVHGGGPVRGRRLDTMDHDPLVADLVFIR